MPTSPPNAPCTHVYRLQNTRLTALYATLNLALINPLDTPNCRQRDAILAGIATYRGGDAAGGVASSAYLTSSTTGAEASGTASSGS